MKKRVLKIWKTFPKYQALAKVEVDLDGSFESLKKEKLNPRLTHVGRVKDKADENAIEVSLENPLADALITRSTLQISSPSKDYINEALNLFEKHLAFMPGQADRRIQLESINEPNIIIEERLLTLVEGLMSLDAQTVDKMRPFLKKALDPYLSVARSV